MAIRKPLLAVALAATLVGGAYAQSHRHAEAAPPRDALPRDAQPRDAQPRDAQPRDAQSRPLRPMDPERMFEGLDLSDAQRTQLRGMADEHRAVIEPLRDKMRAAQQTLQSTQPGDPDHDAKTADARKTLQETRGQMREEMEEFRARTDAVLTPEQRTQVEARRSEMRERMGERRGGRGGMEGRGGRRGDGTGGRPRRGG